MKSGYMKHFLVIGAGTFISMFLGFITTPIITRLVTPSEYGQYSIFVLYSNIAVMILCIGLDQSLVRYYYEENSIAYKIKLLHECVKAPLIIALIASAVIIGAVSVNGELFDWNNKIIILLCFFTVVQLIYRFSQLVVRLEYNSKLYSKLNVLNKILYIVFVLTAFKFADDKTMLALAKSITCATFICMCVSIMAQKNLWLNTTNYKGIRQKTLIKYGAPYIISMGITMLFQACDQLSINYYCDYGEVGIYASAMTLVHIFGIVQTTFNTMWSPMAVEHYAKEKEDVSFYQKGNQAITVIMFVFGISVIMLKDVIVFLLGEKYREAATILPFLIFNPIMYTISETTVSGLVFKKKSGMQVLVAMGACISNVIGNTILVPKYGCTGAAISTGLSYIVFFALRTFTSNCYFYVDYKLKKFYFLTFSVVTYAFYNTFWSNKIVVLCGGVVLILMILFFYKESVIWMLDYGQRQARNVLSKE